MIFKLVGIATPWVSRRWRSLASLWSVPSSPSSIGLRLVSLPPDPPSEIQRCDAEYSWPDPSTLLKNDARPGIALLEQGVYAGRDCRTVVAGWAAWWSCQKAVAIDPGVRWDSLVETMKGMRKGRVEPF